MQTLERPPSLPGSEPPRRARATGAIVAAAVVGLPLLVLLVVSRVGVVIAVLLAVLAGLALWVRRKGFLFIELVAFLIHFDGLGAGPIRLGRIMSAAAICLILYKLLVERWRPPAIPTRHWLPVLLITVYAVISGIWSDSAGGWFYAMGLLGLALSYFAVAGLLVDSHESIHRYIRAYWYGGLCGSAAGILALFIGTRSEGLIGDPNYFGMVQASLVPVTVYYRRHARTALERNLYSFALFVVLAGAAGAGSRSGLLGGAIAIVATMVTRPGLAPARRARVAVGAVVLAGIAFSIGFVANPANLQRGFADRGAGRLDFWAVTVDLIQDRPVLGHGFGQLSKKIIPNMTVTPGVEELIDTRDSVSSHNTWLDIVGDLGVIGIALWVTIFVVAILGFLRPRWRQMKELSMVLFVMMLPVLSSSTFQPLLNNKLAWSLIGLSAALQVPSWGTRWRGFVSPQAPELPAATGGAGGGAVATIDAPTSTALATSFDAGPPLDASAVGAWEAPDLARWDVRISRRFRFAVVAGAAIGAVTFGAVMSVLPSRYSANASIVVPDLQATRGGNRVAIDRTGVQVINSLITSGAYAQDLQRRAGLDLTVPEIRDRVTVARPKFGAYMELTYTDTDEENTRKVSPQLIPTLDALIAESRKVSEAQMADELRPVVPGEQRYDTSPLFLPVYDDPTIEVQPPKVVWGVFIGGLSGAVVAVAFVLLQQRRPRVNNDDDLLAAIGMHVWTHVGRSGRRYAATGDQYAQVATMASELVGAQDEPRRIVVATPRTDPAARSLAAGLAAAIAAEDRRVVLIDAHVDAPWLSRRLGGGWRSGLLQVLDGAPIEPLLRPVNRWRLPTSVRRTLGDHGHRLRFLPLGRRRRGTHPVIRPDVLDRFGPDVTLVVLAPSLTADAPVGALLAWADATVLTLVEGRTVTFDAEDAAAPVRTFATGPSGVVMMDV